MSDANTYDLGCRCRWIAVSNTVTCRHIPPPTYLFDLTSETCCEATTDVSPDSMPSDWRGCDTYRGRWRGRQGKGGRERVVGLHRCCYGHYVSGHYAARPLTPVQGPARSRQLAVAGIADMQLFILRCMRLMPNELSAETDSSPVLASPKGSS